MYGFSVIVWLICLVIAIVKTGQKRPAKIWWAVGGVAFVAIIAMSGGSDKTNSADAQKPGSVGRFAAARHVKPDAPAPTPNRHDEREQIQRYWNPIILKMAFAQTTLDVAIKSVGEGDKVSASALLEKGSEYAKDAMMATSDAHPEELNDVADDLGVAANEFRQGLDDIRAYLDDNKPSQGASAQEHAAEARSRLASATHAARMLYIRMGGKGTDLEDEDAKRQQILSTLKAFSQ